MKNDSIARKPVSNTAPAEPSNSEGSDDPFDATNLNSMRLSQDFATMAAVKPDITNIAVRKPHKHEFVRVRSGTEWQFDTGCFDDQESREVYLVAPKMWPTMPGGVTPTCLVLTVSRNSPVPFLWPLKLPDGERPNRWHESAIEAARKAESNWIRVEADMSASQYVPYVAVANLPDPEWPEDLLISDYMRLAFKSRFVEDLQHPVLKRLRGEV